MISTTQTTPVFTLGTSQTFRLSGTEMDKIIDVNVIAKNASVSWSASIDRDAENSSTSLVVVATPSLADGGELPSEDDQVFIKPVGSHFKLHDSFSLNGSPPIHCTVLSDGTTVYTPTEELALVAQYAA